MRVLLVTNMYPTDDKPAYGVFVEDQVESLRRLGVEMDVFFVDGRRNRLNYLLAYPRFWKQLLTHGYDLVHAHYVYSGLVARAQWRCPVVLSHHGIEVFMFRRQAALSRMVTPAFDQVIVMSPEMKDRLGHDGAHIIPCGVDLERFRPMPVEQARAALGLPMDKKLVLWAGDPVRPQKRFDLVQAATDLLREEDPSVELLLLSGKPHSDVPMYMNACNVLLLVSDGEGSPMVVKEAMACNLPVVATPAGDVAQVIGETAGCHLCTQDPRNIADNVKRVLDVRKRTGGREAIQRFSLDSIARQVLGVYEEALGLSRKVREGEPAQLTS